MVCILLLFCYPALLLAADSHRVPRTTLGENLLAYLLGDPYCIGHRVAGSAWLAIPEGGDETMCPEHWFYHHDDDMGVWIARGWSGDDHVLE